MNKKSTSLKQKIVHRVPRDKTHPYGIVDATTIPIDTPCVVVIGGERTVSRKDANHYASILNQLLCMHNLDDIAIYSAYYPDNIINRGNERAKLFKAAQQRIKQHTGVSKSPENEYIYDLYQSIIQPRIISKNNEKFSDIEVMHNLHRVMIYTHCHGAAVVRVFQDLMLSDLDKYGYNHKSVPQIMKHLLVVQHAPTAPIHNSLFNTISFMSASDTLMDFHNQFSAYVSEHPEDLPPSYFRSGNFFATYKINYQALGEHQIAGLMPWMAEDELTPDGKIIMTAERNAIINGLNLIKSPELKVPSARELIAPLSDDDPVKPDFDALKRNGDFFMTLMRNDLKQSRKQSTR